MIRLMALSALAAGAMSVAAPAMVAAAAPAASATVRQDVDPVTFFTGTTVGDGQLKKMLSGAQETHDVSRGHVEQDGTLVLDQTVRIGNDKPLARHWRLHEDAPGQFSGTISDAAGKVEGQLEGRVLSIAYRTKGKMDVRQQITFAPDGQSARNEMKIRRFGMTLATLEGTITRR
ncbi:DUF3833 family protein [Novosphingobium sp. ZN18A2]|uniref:DUF3833 family protein n=1 Tax=Novosphingobium sp. ZN18A2 TaxID=3079861 RepID=UPI0030CC3744